MALPLITLLIAICLTGIYLVLSAHVIRTRRNEQASVTSVPSEPLQRAIRAHSNFMEYTPIFLILLMLLELSDSYLWWISGLGISFIIGRLSHAYGILIGETGSPPAFGGRVRGMILTLSTLGAAALSGLILIGWIVLH